MNKNFFIKLSKFSVLFLSLIIFAFFTTKTFASVTPTVSLSGTGNGDSVQITISGDPNASVLLFYTQSGSGQQYKSIGTTNSSGGLTTTVSSSQYGIPAGASVYVTTNGLNGTQSATVAWPNVASTLSASNMLSLSQTGLVLPIGQSTTITASNLNGSSVFLSTNSNPVIANFSVSGGTITVTANSYGSTTGTFCLVTNTSNCGSVYLIVQNSGAQSLSFSQSSVTLSSGQTVTVQISGGSGNYSVFNNTSQNGGTVSTSIANSVISLTTASTTGSASITVCSSDMSSCGIINVTIGNTSTSAISFSQTNPTVTVGQSLSVSIFGPTNSLFYVASNSNPSILQANLSSNTLTLLGIANGSSTLSICASTSNCGSLTINVNSNSSNGGTLMLSQQNVTLGIGQTASVTISGDTMPYNIISSATNVIQTVLNVNIITLSGLATGTSMVNVCSNSGHCLTLSVTVTRTNTALTTLPTGCTSTAGYSQTTGQLCSSVSTTITTTILPADCLGVTQYSQSTGQLCANYVAPTPVVEQTTEVANASGTAGASNVGTGTFKFTKTLNLGSKGTDVIELQKKLKALGFYTGKVDGGFGPILEKAVKAFQKKHNLPQVGSVGPKTRALLNG
jgi:hypothetical protein